MDVFNVLLIGDAQVFIYVDCGLLCVLNPCVQAGKTCLLERLVRREAPDVNLQSYLATVGAVKARAAVTLYH